MRVFMGMLAGVSCFSGALIPADIVPPGHRPLPPGIHALQNGRIVTQPGTLLERGTIIIRDGLIEAVGGTNTVVPADARIWDLTGTTIYAGLIDPYLALQATNAPVSTTEVEPFAQSLTAGTARFFGVPGQEKDPGNPGPGYPLAALTPERKMAATYTPDAKTLEQLRELGFTAGNIVPLRGIVRGKSCLVALADAEPNETIIREEVFQHIAFATDTGRDDAYPRSLMGVIAAVRQAVFDAQHHLAEREFYRTNTARAKRPPLNAALDGLAPAIRREMPVVFEPGSVLMTDRAARIGRELNLNFIMLSSGQDWRRPDLITNAGGSFIVPLNLPAVSKLPEDDDWNQISLDQLRAWDWAAENPALLRANGAEIAFTTFGLTDRKQFRAKLQQALDRGLTENDALAALTVVPAKLCGVSDRLGTIAPGKLANLTVVQGTNYFLPDARVREVWIDGAVYYNPPADVKGPAVRPEDQPKTPEGGDPAKPAAPEKPATPPATPPRAAEKPATEPDKEKKGERVRQLLKQRVARSPLEGRGPLRAPDALLIESATLWTCGPAGVLTNGHLLIVGGKIRAVGGGAANLAGVDAARIHRVNAGGRHVTPGLIDAHSHSYVLGSVNEGTLPSTAMVRIGDVVNSEAAHIYKQLAGGLTVANLLHGSANPIGGQNTIVKLREGASPEAMKFEGAPAGIKFALGENVKQSNWGEQRVTRFPQTRMGVRTFFANRFEAARAYAKKWETHRAAGGAPPRRELELDTLAEIIAGQRWIHCHSYRQDEILAFLRLMSQFGVKVGTLQHVLEGYKVADEIAAHGAGGSCFADWWAYKFEVYDAIPHAGSLMRERGVVVSFNSDSSDLARRLNLEAAKAVKYGGTPDGEALKFVTLNPAQQLGIAQRVGSLEPGKDGDFALWSHAPLDSRTVCLETWIEGKQYFDRSAEAARAAKLDAEREALLKKAKQALSQDEAKPGEKPAADPGFFAVALEHRFDNVDRHCED